MKERERNKENVDKLLLSVCKRSEIVIKLASNSKLVFKTLSVFEKGTKRDLFM